MLKRSKTMNSDAEYPLEYSKEKYVMLRRSVFDAMQTRIDDLEVKLATIATLTAERDEWKAIAQSYDGCLEGIALKLERKKVAELVLENRAYDLRMDNDGKRIDELEAELATVKESLTTAEATIDKLPKTADGVPVVPKMTVYALHDGCIEPAVVSDFWDWDSDEYEWDDGPGVPCRLKATQWKSIYLSWCYSTREAALAAKGGK